ncbi:MAG: hypothetical protein U0807_03135 [Candidatus Binatia bacterium]
MPSALREAPEQVLDPKAYLQPLFLVQPDALGEIVVRTLESTQPRPGFFLARERQRRSPGRLSHIPAHATGKL